MQVLKNPNIQKRIVKKKKLAFTKIKKRGSIKISSTSKVFDVPYSGYFSTEEVWEILPNEGNADKCLLICSGWVNFNKSTFMKKTITQRNIQGLKEDYETWVERVTKML